MENRIYQVELTNFCNAKCEFCPYMKMTRKKGWMRLETVRKIIKKIKGKQKYIALHHFGEPLLHSSLFHIIRMFDEAGIKCEFSTNGGLLTDGKIQELISSPLKRLRIGMDYFNPIKQVEKLLKKNKSIDIRLHTVRGNLPYEKKPFDNFAGQVEGKSEWEKGECYFKKYNYFVVLWTGEIVPCCCDYDGKNILGTIDNFDKVKHKDYEMCKDCPGYQFAEKGEWEK